jgi:hypothetical protein
MNTGTLCVHFWAKMIKCTFLIPCVVLHYVHMYFHRFTLRARVRY